MMSLPPSEDPGRDSPRQPPGEAAAADPRGLINSPPKSVDFGGLFPCDCSAGPGSAPMSPLLKLPPIPNIMGGRRDCSGMEQHQSPIRRDPPQTAGGQTYDPGGICRLMRDQPGILWTHRARGTQRHLRAVPANLRGNRALFFRIICRYRLKTSYMALSKRPRGCTIRPQRRHTGRPQAICRRKGALL